MLDGMTETPEKSPSEPPERPDRHERDDSADTERDTIALPSHVAGSGTLDRLVETARDYARQAASENTASRHESGESVRLLRTYPELRLI